MLMHARNSLHVLTLIIECVRVNIYLMTVGVAKNKVAVSRVTTRQFLVASCRKELAQLRNILMWPSNVKIAMRPRLRTKQCVDTPTAVNVDFNAVMLH